ncbi:MAG: DNA polymerase III subunit delta' [Acidimicrobiia bacterium]|nr:DNA polymerase III subunit delta' [Acidimicrobiia bacterium]
MSVLEGLVGQQQAVQRLSAAAATPVHAYLFAGPPGSGKRDAARAFAAALLCPNGGDGTCDVCRRVLGGVHPDVVVVERSGPYITVEQAREIVRLAMRSPNEGRRKVLVLTDFHLVKEAAPTLLKVIEEPPESTVFVILADHIPVELETIASRCVRIDFRAIGRDELVATLVREGVERLAAEEAADAANGRLDRARLLASDPDLAARRQAWRRVPGRLDGTGAAVAVVAAELAQLIATAGVDPLHARHRAELEALEERATRYGDRVNRRQVDEQHRRELRRLRIDELRFGLATLQQAYRDALVDGSGPTGQCLDAVDAIVEAAEALERNPNETLLIQSLLLKLPSLP